MSCILFREKLTGKKVLCLVLAVGGCALVSGLASGSVGEISTGGILIGLASGFTYALYSIFSTYALKKYQPLTVTFYTFLNFVSTENFSLLFWASENVTASMLLLCYYTGNEILFMEKSQSKRRYSSI